MTGGHIDKELIEQHFFGCFIVHCFDGTLEIMAVIENTLAASHETKYYLLSCEDFVFSPACTLKCSARAVKILHSSRNVFPLVDSEDIRLSE